LTRARDCIRVKGGVQQSLARRPEWTRSTRRIAQRRRFRSPPESDRASGSIANKQELQLRTEAVAQTHSELPIPTRAQEARGTVSGGSIRASAGTGNAGRLTKVNRCLAEGRAKLRSAAAPS
jgi:hypothetical protein